jgi:hypothetical protein
VAFFLSFFLFFFKYKSFIVSTKVVHFSEETLENAEKYSEENQVHRHPFHYRLSITSSLPAFLVFLPWRLSVCLTGASGVVFNGVLRFSFGSADLFKVFNSGDKCKKCVHQFS